MESLLNLPFIADVLIKSFSIVCHYYTLLLAIWKNDGFGWVEVMDLTFFTAACMVLCFAFVAKTVDHRAVFSLLLDTACPLSRLSLPLSFTLTSGWAGVRQEAGRGHSLGYNLDWVIPYHMTSCSATKDHGKDKEGGMFGVIVCVFPVNCYACWDPSSHVTCCVCQPHMSMLSQIPTYLPESVWIMPLPNVSSEAWRKP